MSRRLVELSAVALAAAILASAALGYAISGSVPQTKLGDTTLPVTKVSCQTTIIINGGTPLPHGTGYYLVINQQGTSTISATWTPSVKSKMKLYISSGNPFGGSTAPGTSGTSSLSAPPGSPLVSGADNTTSISVTTS